MIEKCHEWLTDPISSLYDSISAIGKCQKPYWLEGGYQSNIPYQYEPLFPTFPKLHPAVADFVAEQADISRAPHVQLPAIPPLPSVVWVLITIAAVNLTGCRLGSVSIMLDFKFPCETSEVRKSIQLLKPFSRVR